MTSTDELENGWYLRSEGYMTPEYGYQRITAMKANRALDIHGRLVFVRFVGGEEDDSRVYVSHPGVYDELKALVHDILSEMRCRRSCADCPHERDEGCEFMDRAIGLGVFDEPA